MQCAPLILQLYLKWFTKNKKINTRVFTWISGIGISYSNKNQNKLSHEDFPAHAPIPGDRLPYLVFETEGITVDLFDILDPRKFTLLVFGMKEIPETFQKVIDEYISIISIKHIQTEAGTLQLFESLGIKNEGWYLIRPDMHIALRSNELHLTALSDYIKNYLK